MAQFKSLSPQEMKAFRRAKDALVSVPTAPPPGGYLHPPMWVTMLPVAQGGPVPFLPGPPPPFPQGADLLSALEMPLASFGKFSPSLWSASPSLCRGSAQPCSWG